VSLRNWERGLIRVEIEAGAGESVCLTSDQPLRPGHLLSFRVPERPHLFFTIPPSSRLQHLRDDREQE
jgi:hypothetical protein